VKRALNGLDRNGVGVAMIIWALTGSFVLIFALIQLARGPQ
jgi:hypothetical protein